MPTYKKVPQKVTNLVKQRVANEYASFLEVQVKFDVLFAFGATKESEAGEVVTSPALKDRGHPVLGKVKVCSAADRAKGTGDVEIVLDGDAWANLEDEQQVALVDRMLAHFELITNVDSEQQYDSNKRPKIRKNWGDYMLYGFIDVAERHGEHSIEVKQLAELSTGDSQLLFGFLKDVAGAKAA